jgi:hypothetical protein
MLDWPSTMSREANDEAYSFPLDNWGKSFSIIDASSLLKTTSNEAGFVSDSNAVRARLGAIYPSSSDGLLTSWQ